MCVNMFHTDAQASLYRRPRSRSWYRWPAHDRKWRILDRWLLDIVWWTSYCKSSLSPAVCFKLLRLIVCRRATGGTCVRVSASALHSFTSQHHDSANHLTPLLHSPHPTRPHPTLIIYPSSLAFHHHIVSSRSLWLPRYILGSSVDLRNLQVLHATY